MSLMNTIQHTVIVLITLFFRVKGFSGFYFFFLCETGDQQLGFMAEDQRPRWTGPVRGFMDEMAVLAAGLLRKREIPHSKPFFFSKQS